MSRKRVIKKRLDESLSWSLIYKTLYGDAGYEIDVSKIRVDSSGNVQPVVKEESL